jgi:hypothetical protein
MPNGAPGIARATEEEVNFGGSALLNSPDPTGRAKHQLSSAWFSNGPDLLLLKPDQVLTKLSTRQRRKFFVGIGGLTGSAQ